MSNLCPKEGNVIDPKENAEIRYSLWFRESTQEWVGEIHYNYLGTDGEFRTTGKTPEEARNAAFACIGHCLMECVWNQEPIAQPE